MIPGRSKTVGFHIENYVNVSKKANPKLVPIANFATLVRGGKRIPDAKARLVREPALSRLLKHRKSIIR